MKGAALAAGATRINTLEFTASDTGEARRRALAEAIAQARRDAEAMAEAAGGRLGALVELTSGHLPDPILRARSGGVALAPAQAPPTPVSPGEITVSASVVGRWHFVPR